MRAIEYEVKHTTEQQRDRSDLNWRRRDPLRVVGPDMMMTMRQEGRDTKRFTMHIRVKEKAMHRVLEQRPAEPSEGEKKDGFLEVARSKRAKQSEGKNKNVRHQRMRMCERIERRRAKKSHPPRPSLGQQTRLAPRQQRRFTSFRSQIARTHMGSLPHRFGNASQKAPSACSTRHLHFRDSLTRAGRS